MLSSIENKWFRDLTIERKQIVDVLRKAGLIDVFVSHIVDTYRESAHFIFELLQNADDAQATKVRFQMAGNGLVFAHNGKISFSITDPALERNQGIIPGHINAITTFSLSAKKEDIENKIGKFGIGFKSVFQYTNTPFVFNPPYCFTIEQYMIPKRVNNKNYLMEGETTAFWLPFNKEDKSKDEAFNEIWDRLKSLNNPLLFLRNLTSIHIRCGSNTINFKKEATELRHSSIIDCKAYKVKLDKDSLIRFDKNLNILDKAGKTHKLQVNIGFLTDNGRVTADSKFQQYFDFAWCFFPTRQTTGLNYILNAPFILTPNREALKEGRIENNQLIAGLAVLMESAVQCLKGLGFITEEFYTTIPIPAAIPTEFKPIAEKLLTKLKSGEFVPTKDGKHISVSNSYVCSEPVLANLLSYNNEVPLKKLTNKNSARLVFSDRKLFSDSNLYTFFCKSFCSAQIDLNSTWFGGQFAPGFLEGMPEEFDILFFEYLIERSNAVLGKGQPLWTKKFIPVHNGEQGFEIVSPNDTNGEPQVFIGGEKLNGRYVVVDYLVEIPDIKNFLLNVLNCKIPNEFDDFMYSLEKYEDENVVISRNQAKKDNLKIKKYINELPQLLKDKLINKLKKYEFLPVISSTGNYGYLNPITSVVYLPGQEIENYFSKYKDEFFWLDVKLLGVDKNPDDFKDFIESLAIETIPYCSRGSLLPEGIEMCLNDISLGLSVYLVKVLKERNCLLEDEKLRNIKWVFDKQGKRKAPTEIKYGETHPQYPDYFKGMHLELGAITEIDKYSGLDDKRRAILELIDNSVTEVTEEEIRSAIINLVREKRKQRKNQEEESDKRKGVNSSNDTTTPEGILNSWITEPLANNEIKNLQEGKRGTVIPVIPKSADFWKDEEIDSMDSLDNPGGYMTTQMVGKKYQEEKENKKKKQIEKEIEVESKRNKLLELASQFEPYSFGWFKTLLELEDNFTAEDRVKRNPIRIIFNKATIDSDGILVLSETVYIPPSIEEIGDLSIQLIFGDDKKTIKGEVVSPKKNELHIKLSSPEQLRNIELEKIAHVIVEASTPDFILEKLKVAFARLDLRDADNLKSKEVLPSDLNFVFGPPGTGKTTYLSWLIGGKNKEPLKFCDKEIVPFMEHAKSRVLVLTPTNKAADVLVQRIIKNYTVVDDYPQWLIRFGQTEIHEQEPVFVGDRIVKPWIFDKCTLVTTIARYPYDYFKVAKKDSYDDWSIKDFNWDVIIFDEASMIHHSAILFVLLYARQVNPNVKFYIGGDPFQIHPIIKVEYPYWSYLPEPAYDNEGQPILDDEGEQMAWRQDGGNIYAFVGLMKEDSFINPSTEPYQFLIHNLNIQYRSIVPIGSLFSQFRYSGQLDHHRTIEKMNVDKSLLSLKIEVPGLTLKAISIINFPVKKHEGVFRARTINGSPYQLYSCIFSVELIKYIQKNAILSENEIYQIGIITPYAIQGNIIEKLLNELVSGPIVVSTGTVHGFQGDECNLVIVVLNPPKHISKNPRVFLNKKNILNVAISRAKDKMIILNPYDPDKEIKFSDLYQIKKILNLAYTISECKDSVITYDAMDIEEKLLGGADFIEKNTFPTTHQKVNIYAKSGKLYEIRQDESAIDVQVNNGDFRKG